MNIVRQQLEPSITTARKTIIIFCFILLLGSYVGTHVQFVNYQNIVEKDVPQVALLTLKNGQNNKKISSLNHNSEKLKNSQDERRQTSIAKQRIDKKTTVKQLKQIKAQKDLGKNIDTGKLQKVMNKKSKKPTISKKQQDFNYFPLLPTFRNKKQMNTEKNKQKVQKIKLKPQGPSNQQQKQKKPKSKIQSNTQNKQHNKLAQQAKKNSQYMHANKRQQAQRQTKKNTKNEITTHSVKDERNLKKVKVEKEAGKNIGNKDVGNKVIKSVNSEKGCNKVKNIRKEKKSEQKK